MSKTPELVTSESYAARLLPSGQDHDSPVGAGRLGAGVPARVVSLFA